MKNQHKETPSRTPYLITLCPKNAGSFLLYWLTSKGAKCVTIEVTSKVNVLLFPSFSFFILTVLYTLKLSIGLPHEWNSV